MARNPVVIGTKKHRGQKQHRNDKQRLLGRA
jgi:hypothetical protein